jgi:hypothetical protein
MLSAMLPIRTRKTDSDTALLPAALSVDEARGASGLPLLRGELPAPAPATLAVALQICNSAGIPIIEGRASVAAGEREILFADLRPIGIDAYAHKPVDERAQIAERIWTRRAFGTFQISR